MQRFGKKYHLSWLEHGLDRKFEWEEARNYCRKFCMDSVTFDSPREYRYFKNLIKKGKSCIKIMLNLMKYYHIHKQSHFTIDYFTIFCNNLDDIPYIWTGGRKCNFRGCDRKDLMPTIINGWFWAPTNKKIPAKNKCRVCDWSRTGG